MGEGDFGVDCENCECLTCSENDDVGCQNCYKCTGNINYSNWMMDCESYDECKNPEEAIDDLVEAMEIVDKTKMLKELLDDLKSKTDQEIIQDYRDNGIDVISYDPNTKGKIILRD